MGSSSPHKPELPPLLQPGLHRLTLDGLRNLCVDGFPMSTTRQRLFDGFCNLRSLLVRAAISVEIWIDGSFLTEKIDPDDVDIVIKMRDQKVSTWSDDQKQLLGWFLSENNEDAVYNIFRCHCFGFVTYSDGRSTRESYWRDDAFGLAHRSRERKGIAVIELFDGIDLRLQSHRNSMAARDIRTVGSQRRL